MGYNLDTILKDGEKVFLKSKNNVTAGGDAIDMTDRISPEMKELAISALKAIPTLTHAGVDLIIDEKTNSGAVIEINSRPHITAHLYPSFGDSRDVPSALIDYFFPETVGYSRENRSNLFFDFDTIYELTYLNGNVTEVLVPNIPGDIILKRFTLTIPQKKILFRKWLQLRAKRLQVSGHVKSVSGQLSIVLAGTEKDVNTLIELIEKKLKSYDFKTEFVEKKRTSPVRQGFFNITKELEEPVELPIPKNYHSDVNRLIQAVYDTNNNHSQPKPTEDEFDILKSQLNVLQKQLNQYKQKYGELD